MTDTNSEIPTNNASRTNLLIAVIAPVLVLVGGIFSSSLTWITSYQTSSQGERQSCIKRLDEQEDNLRKKSDVYLSTIAAVASYADYPGFSLQGAAERNESLMKSSYSVMAFAPRELGEETMNLTATLVLAGEGTHDKAVQKDRTNALTAKLTSWPLLFYRVMEDFDKMRKSC